MTHQSDQIDKLHQIDAPEKDSNNWYETTIHQT